MPISSLQEDQVRQALSQVLLSEEEEAVDGTIDDEFVTYLAGLLTEGLNEEQDNDEITNDAVRELLGPFLESMGCSDEVIERAIEAIVELSNNNDDGNYDVANQTTTEHTTTTTTTTRRLKQGIVTMSSHLTDQSESEMEANRYLWGTDSGVKPMANTLMETAGTTAGGSNNNGGRTTMSARDKRKARQELEQARRQYEEQLKQHEGQDNGGNNSGVVSAMVLPDYQSGRNERNVQVKNVSLSLDNGRILLSGDSDLKFAHRRRYGLVGKNGIGKTTLLKAIAAMEIDDFPRHLRVLHVRQELKMNGSRGDDDLSVLHAVLQSDAERNALLQEEETLLRDLEKETAQDNDKDKDNSSSSTASFQERRQRLHHRSNNNNNTKTTMRSSDNGTITEDDTTDDNKKQQKESESNADDFDVKLRKLDEVYERLQVVGSDAAEARAATILSGLQFTPEMQHGPTSALSGGWRMRVALAAALFVEPDILMLDEPTNHLDLEAVLWLESYLVDYKHTLIVVSHDRGFLNEVCTDIIDFDKQKLTYYRGNYETYVKTRDERIKNDMRVYHAYQDKRAHMMEFIEKFRANAKRATMVQSRIKAVEKMDAEAPEPVEVDPVWRFSIPNPEPLGRPIISVDDVSFDYQPLLEDGTKKPESDFLLQKVNFGVDLSSRIGILGANGCGKSTLLNLILGHLQPLRGSVSRNGRLRVGHFTQHSADKFDLQLSAVENMLNFFDSVNADDQEMRSFLGRFQIQGSEALKPMFMLSGGQKSRVAFASLAYQKPHVIIMDEPTNHLDMESIDALVEALQSYQGGLMVVSHDQYFIARTCSRELWVIGDGTAARFRGDFGQYKECTLLKTRKRVEASVKRLSEL